MVLSCQCGKKSNSSIKSIPCIRIANSASSPMPYSRIFKKIEYIGLETISTSFFGTPDKIVLAKDRIFILDKTDAKAILVFDRNGRFVNKLVYGVGKGPG
jgi:hypothetical protein